MVPDNDENHLASCKTEESMCYYDLELNKVSDLSCLVVIYLRFFHFNFFFPKIVVFLIKVMDQMTGKIMSIAYVW